MAGTTPRARSGRLTTRWQPWSSQPLRYSIGDPQGVGNDGQRRVDGTDRGKEARISDIEVIQLVRLAVEVQHGGGGIGAEARRSSLMRRAAHGNVFAEVERAMEKDSVVTSAVQNVLELALQARQCLGIGGSEVEMNLAIPVVNAILRVRQILRL